MITESTTLVTAHDRLQAQLAGIVQRVNDLVITEANEGQAVQFIADLRDLAKRIKKGQGDAVVELKRQIVTLEEPYRQLADVCKTTDDDLRAKLGIHQQQKAERQRIAAETLRAEQAAALRAAAETTATAAAQTGSDGLLNAAVKLEQRAAAVVAAPVVVEKRVVSDDGAKSTLRRSWAYEIVDATAVPRDLCLPDRGLIRAEMNSRKKRGMTLEAAQIPGVRIFEDIGITVKQGGMDDGF